MLVRWFLGLLAAASLVSGVQAAPLEAYGRLPSVEDVTLSPDGQTIGMIVTDGEKRTIVVQTVGDKQPSLTLDVGDVKLRDLVWASPKHLIITKSDTTLVAGLMGPRREYAMAFVYDVDSRKLRPLMKGVDSSMNVSYGEIMVRTVAGQPVVFLQGVHFVQNRGRLALYRAELNRPYTKLVDGESEFATDWAVNADGEILARSEYDPRTMQAILKVKTAAGWRPMPVLADVIERPNLSGLGRDGASILVTQLEKGRATMREIARGAMIWGEPLPIENYRSPLRDPATHTLIGGFAQVGDEARYTFFNPNDQKIWKAIQTAYPDNGIRLISWSADRRRIIIYADSPTEGPAYALVDLDTRKGSWLGTTYAGLKVEDISPVKPIRFKAKDGLEITGYLTTPRGKAVKDLPLVVFPHGGPAVRDSLGFDWWAQAMASRGYAVLQVNYRGSDGFGWEFLSAGFGQWGRKMQTDLSDGVRYLASQGSIDPKRVCIVGASYGGYAALAGVSLDKDVYRCAASVAGPSDLARMVSWSRRQSGITAQRYWLRFMGAENVHDDVLDTLSPALLTDRVQAPVLLIHGRDDTVVPLEQSRFMADALKRSGRNVEFTTLAGDDHRLSRGETRLQMLRSVVDFLEKHNPPT